MAESPRKKLTLLLQWFRTQEVWWDTNAVDIVYYHDPDQPPLLASTSGEDFAPTQASPAGGALPADHHYDLVSGRNGMAVVALRDLAVDEVVVRIPKSAVLSSKNCAVANVLEDEEVEGRFALTVAIMFEMAQGTASPWYGYLQSLPAYVPTPLVWHPTEIAWLKGTDLATDLVQVRQDLEEVYNTALLPLVQKHSDIFQPNEFYSLERFMWATILVNSRAFQVDNYHGDAMVPFADIFNHLTGGEHVHLEGNGEVCDVCGEYGGCNHTMEDDSDSSSGESMDEGEEETMDYHWHISGGTISNDSSSSDPNEVPSLAMMEAEDVDAEEMEESASETASFESVDEDAMDMCIVKPVRAHREVFNIYGEQSSSYLLHHYGFADLDNPHDIVTLELAAVVNFCDQHPDLRARLPAITCMVLKFHSVFLLSISLTSFMKEPQERVESKEEREETLNYFPIDFHGTVDCRLLTLLTLLYLDPADYDKLWAQPAKYRRVFLATLRQWFEKLTVAGLNAPGEESRQLNASAKYHSSGSRDKKRKATQKKLAGLSPDTVAAMQAAHQLVRDHRDTLAHVFRAAVTLLNTRVNEPYITDAEFNALEPRHDLTAQEKYRNVCALRHNERAILHRAIQNYQQLLDCLAV